LFYQFNDPHPDRFKFKRNWIQLGDSLFMLRWTDSSAGLVGIPIRRDMFEDEAFESIWMEGRDETTPLSTWPLRLADGLLVALFLLLAAGGFAVTGPGRRLRLRFRGSRPNGPDLAGSTGSMNVFLQNLKPSERQVLVNLLRASHEGRSVGTEELNRWLGMSRRGTELQKITRNRALQQINSTFRLSMRVDKDLVERVRDLRDRRLQSYRVSEDFAAPLAEAMAANGEELPPAKP
jgi:hypothetical protein